jgi:hypothetical protein
MKTQWDLAVEPENIYFVPKKLWAKWPRASQALFNQTMDNTADRFCLAPSVSLSADDWWTIQWNIAWIAADNLARMLKAPRGGK